MIYEIFTLPSLYTQISRLAFRPGTFDRVSHDLELVKRNEIELLLGGLDSMIRKNRKSERINFKIEAGTFGLSSALKFC